ncbi:hypothetical protein ANCDUO_20057, partial [Ancylostoma duodenale]
KPKVYAKTDSKLFDRISKHVPVLQKVYTLPWWCPFGDAQTIVSGTLRKCPPLPFVREVIEFEDGGALGIDWLHPDGCTADAPIVLFLPGITGTRQNEIETVQLEIALTSCTQLKKYVLENGVSLFTIRADSEVFIYGTEC